MYFKQFYLGCLAHASYLIGDEGEAVVVDPRRDIDEYLEAAREQGLEIRHVIETHSHADFVSGHREIAWKTGAKIHVGAAAGARFEHVPASEGDEIRLGRVVLRFLETPGHTPDSVSILVIDEAESIEPKAVLTGDTLFIGDVGRPDLLGGGETTRALAGKLHDSLHGKLMKLPDSVAVYPAHGAGSMCGRNISSETSSTIGEQRKFNYALQPMSREAFIEMMTTDLPEAPAYFGRDAMINREGPAILADLPAPLPLAPQQLRAAVESGAIAVDTRSSSLFGAGHVPGSLNISLSGEFASWAGTVIALDSKIVLVTEDDAQVAEARIRLARVGIENVTGFLAGGIAAWDAAGLALARVEQIGVEELERRIFEGSAGQLIDVRRPAEFRGGHIPGARPLPLNHLGKDLGGLSKEQPVTAICAGGFRSSLAASLLVRGGFSRVTNVVGGMSAWTNSNYAVVAG
jgi:glyoxylase-like metal-dependent hydrolase (beta-lactamase superfamily II)